MIRPYYSFSQYLLEKFGERVHRIPVDAGFTCPNRDGTKGVGGCIYCDPGGSGSPWCRSSLSVEAQLLQGIANIRKKFNANKFIAYFQAFSNTYAPLSRLSSLYREALNVPGVIGLAIGTRPDIVPDETLDLIESFARKSPVWLEYGIQSIHKASLEWMNRGHGFEVSRDAILRTAERSILTVAHVILGLPGETWQNMMETAHAVSLLPLHGIKIHHLYVNSDSPLSELYSKGMFDALEENYFVQLVTDFLERLPPWIVVHRIMGDCSREQLIAPQWSSRKANVLRKIDREFERRGTAQGYRFLKTFETSAEGIDSHQFDQANNSHCF